MAKHWIQSIGMKKGALHKEMGVPQGHKIPQAKLAKAAHAGGKLGQRARFAEELEGFHGTGKNTHAQEDPSAKPRAHADGGKKLRPNNPHGNPGFHPSTKGFHHEGSVHSSKDR